MPFFRPKNGGPEQPPDVKMPQQSARITTDDPQASQHALEIGQLVPAALRRLQSLSDSKSFTSDLTVNEFALLRSSGLQPICQVAGTAVYRIGYQPMPYGGSQELTVISNAFNETRNLAVGRLQQEAHVAHADAVVGTRVTQGYFDSESGLIEFSLVGTAVKSLDGRLLRKKDNAAILTTLSGQDLHLLLENGFVPIGLVGATSCYLATLSPYTFQQMYSLIGGNMMNFEIKEFTDGFYASRKMVMRSVERAARAFGAKGIIDVKFRSATNSYQMQGLGSENVGAVAFTTHVLATAVAEPREANIPTQKKILFIEP